MAKKKQPQNGDEQPQKSLKERLAESASEAPAAEPKAGKKARPVIKLSAEEAKPFDLFAAFSVVAANAEGKRKTWDGMVRPNLKQRVLRQWLDAASRSHLESYAVVTDASSCNFVTKDMGGKQLKIPLDLAKRQRSFEQWLTDSGIPSAVIASLKKEVNERTIQALISPDDLEADGKTELADKIRLLYLENLTPEERKVAVQNQSEVKFKDGFVDRAPSHFKGLPLNEAIELLDKLYDLTKVLQWQVSQIHSADTSIAVKGMDKEPETAPIELFTADKNYKFVIQGNEITVLRVTKNGDVRIGVKPCKDNPHAQNTAKKCVRDAEYLASVLEEIK